MNARDYSTISVSAKKLLLVKAQTDLPFARAAAELVFGSKTAIDENANDPEIRKRRAHFELRSKSLDEALRESHATRILEIASGFSFRGLAWAAERDVVYVDTDLPGIASLKAELARELHPAPLVGTLRVQALDALDQAAFRAVVRDIPSGELAIVHEGLLMYLDESEKSRLAATVRETLLVRGGVWITADIYVRSETHLHRDASTEKFLAEHKVEENKFADFAAAENFFATNGFAIAKRHMPPGDSWRVRQTWTLRANA